MLITHICYILAVFMMKTADTSKNCAKCGKGFKIGTNEVCNIKINIRLGDISKIFCFCSYTKGISLNP